MASINFSNPYNIVTFCETRLNPQAIDKLIKENNGLADQTAVDEALKKGDYKRVLTAIWSEKNKERRLTWLRSKQNEFHAPLLFEQGIAEFVAAPTANTIINISMLLFMTAADRTDQDAQCCRDASVSNGDAAVRMLTLYNRVQDNAIKKYCKPAENIHALLAHLDYTTILSTQILPKFLKLLKQIAEQNLPSPEWIGYHGGKINMYPSSEWKARRDTLITKQIAFITKQIEINMHPSPEWIALRDAHINEQTAYIIKQIQAQEKPPQLNTQSKSQSDDADSKIDK